MMWDWNRNQGNRLLWISFLFSLLLVWQGADPVGAHGGGDPRLENVAAGPYWVSAWTSPANLRADETIHLTVSVATPPDDSASNEAGAAVLDAVVLVLVEDASGEKVVTTRATHEDATVKYLYETDFTLPDAGSYDVIISVEANAVGGNVSFPVILAPSRPSLLLLLILVAILALLIVAVWLARHGPNTRRA